MVVVTVVVRYLCCRFCFLCVVVFVDDDFVVLVLVDFAVDFAVDFMLLLVFCCCC